MSVAISGQYTEPPKYCPNCKTDYDPIYMCCPECGYPAQDIGLFEGDDRELEHAARDCADNKHDYMLQFKLIGLLTIEGCSVCGTVRIEILDGSRYRAYFVRYRPEFRRFDKQS